MAMKCSIFWGSLLYPWTSLIVIILFLNVHIKPKFILDPLGTSVHWFNPVSQQIILYFCEVSYLSWAQLLVFKKKLFSIPSILLYILFFEELLVFYSWFSCHKTVSQSIKTCVTESWRKSCLIWGQEGQWHQDTSVYFFSGRLNFF